ncbi:MAG: hypothetical protein ACXVCG_16995 [Bdellovibrionota bacterium]
MFEPKQKHGDATQLATLKFTQNQVLQKADGTLFWQSPKDGSALFREDAVATMGNSQAVIAFADNSELIVEPNSLVILEMAPPIGTEAPRDGAQIVTRLIRGSMKRRNTGRSKILVKLSSDPNAEAAVLDDPHGSAIFRLVHDSAGLRIIIEGGTLTVNGKDNLKEADTLTLAMGGTKLPPPRLLKPSVETRFQKPPRKGGHTRLERIWNFLVPSANAADEAEDESIQVRIHFDWELVPDASHYLIQISKDPAFADVVLEKKVKGTEFVYEFLSPNERAEFFFRAAAISGTDQPGKFSDPQRIEVLPKKTPVFDRPAKKAASMAPPAEKHAREEKAAPEPARVEAPVETLSAPLPSALVEVAIGAAAQRRQFKNTTQTPKTAQGSGVVPAAVRIEGRFRLSESRFLSVGASDLLEVSKPVDALLSTQKVATPLWRLWLLYGARWNSLLLSGGPYASSSSVISLTGFTLTSQSKVLLGAAGRASPHPDTPVLFYWSLQAGLLAAGSTGADLSVSLRRPFRGFGSFSPFKLSEEHGLFWVLEGQGRLSKLENSSAAMLELGYLF